MNVETRESKLEDFLCKKLDSFDGIAENDALVDLELSEERVKTVKLLLLLKVCVVLG